MLISVVFRYMASAKLFSIALEIPSRYTCYARTFKGFQVRNRYPTRSCEAAAAARRRTPRFKRPHHLTARCCGAPSPPIILQAC